MHIYTDVILICKVNCDGHALKYVANVGSDHNDVKRDVYPDTCGTTNCFGFVDNAPLCKMHRPVDTSVNHWACENAITPGCTNNTPDIHHVE